MACCAGRGFMFLNKSPNGAVVTDLLISKLVKLKAEALTDRIDKTSTSAK